MARRHHSWHLLSMPFVFRCLVLTALLVSLALAAPARAQSLVQTGPLSFAPLVRHVTPAVVSIAVRMTVPTSEATEMPAGVRGSALEKSFLKKHKSEQMAGAGAGFILDPSGIIVTNNHVVGSADQIMVTLSDGTKLPAHLIAHDELTDIAVIKVNAGHPLPFVPWGDSRQVQVGDWILAAGNPFGLGGSVTAGIVSARGREIGAGPFDDFFQLDAPINPGNSGGPAFNMMGQVIALNTAIVSPTGGSVGIGFAIPAEIAAHIVDDLRTKGHVDRGWLGVTLDEPSHKRPGAVIATISPQGPAGRAGIKQGDLITSINGDIVTTPRDLILAVAGINPGGAAHLKVRRQKQIMDITLTVGRRPPETAKP